MNDQRNLTDADVDAIANRAAATFIKIIGTC